MSYRIRTIAERTGVPAMTLRSWERRYGFPQPKRTESGYRTYSDEDLRQVLAVKALLADGAVISEAIAQVQKGAEPMVAGPLVEALLDELFEAAQAMSETQIERIATRAETGMSPRAFCHDFALPALRRAADELDVAREHLASSVLRSHLRRVFEKIPAPTKGRPIILACPEGEEHEGGLLAVAIDLRLRAVRTLLLGANTPAAAIAVAVKRAKARAVGLSLVNTRKDTEVSRIVREVVAVRVPVVVGGPAARKRLKLVYDAGARFAESADELLEELT